MNKSGRARLTAVALSGWITLGLVLAFTFYSNMSAKPSLVPRSTAGAAITGPDQLGYFWVQKKSGSWVAFSGTGTVGQAVLQVNRPGTYRFYYKVNNDPDDFIYLKDLHVFILPEKAVEGRRIANSADFLAHKVFPFSPNYAGVVEFSVTTPGRYLAGFGPYNGSIIFRDAGGNSDKRANLGLKITGPDAMLVDLEAAVDFTTWTAPDGTMYVQQSLAVAK